MVSPSWFISHAGVLLCDGSEYRGDYVGRISQMEFENFYRQRIKAVQSTNLIAFETIPSLIEAKVILLVLSEFPSVRAWISFSCKDEEHISSGENFADVQDLFQHPQIDAIGINCTAPSLISSLIQLIEEPLRHRLIVYPNSGEIWKDSQWHWPPSGRNSVGLEAFVKEWRDLGIGAIGGCCRTSPDTIARIKLLLSD
eukprot:TRINITY_DN3391_c0_g1_i6.p1 TRINITY_DN3391_c0_g1~~TRINITY_DN3391_c0_g1_i6.p1  ORF type:complete len:198 (+),score=43.71 TRINITY_DN3391_c0_g1_i6:360-953(+)